MRRFALVLTTLVLVLGACGTDPAEEVQSDGDDAPSDGGLAPSDVDGGYLAKVAKDTLAQDSGRYEMTMTYAGDMDGTAFDATMTASGEYDNAVPASRFAMDMGSFMDQMGSLAEAAGEDMGGMELMGDIDWTMEVVQIGDTVYLRAGMLGMLASMFGGEVDSDAWFRVDASEMGADDMSSLTGTTGVDPSVFLGLVQGAGDEVTDLGRVDVRGTETTGYGVEVSVADAVEAMGDAEQAAATEEMLSGMGVGDYLELTFPVEVYVDDAGVVRRVVIEMDVAEMGATLDLGADVSGSMTVTMSMDFFDQGADIAIEAPPADQVQDLDELMGAGMLEGFGSN